MINPDEYKDKLYLVTGASGAVGQAICGKLAACGARLVLLARNQKNLQSAADKLQGQAVELVPFDMSAIEKIDGLVADLINQCGQFSGIVYCVGNGDICRLRDLSFERLHAILLANFYGYIQLVRSFYVKKEKKFPMSIVGLSSLSSSSPEKYFTAYSASKSAMESATRCLALETTAKNMTIKMVSPGVIASPRVEAMGEIMGDLEDKIKKSGFQPMGLIPVSDVAAMVVFLLGEYARFINGCAVPVNGGAAY